VSEKKKLPAAPIGVIASLSAGFDTVIQGWWILLFPLALDLFLWFGPRLSIRPVVEKILPSLAAVTENALAIDLIRQAAGELNYFSSFSVTPLGVPNLMSLKLPQTTPLGLPFTYSVSNELLLLAIFFGLSLGGLLAGGVYLGLIAQQVRDGAPNLPRLLNLLPRYWISILILIIVILLFGIMLGLPILLVVALLSSVSVWIATLAVWVGFMIFAWLLFHLFFTVHGLLLSEQPLLTAAWPSLRLTAFNSFPAMGLLALILSISAGLNYLWSLPQEDSWMLLIGVAGHAVISGGLAAATFSFYQDRYRYWQELRGYFAPVAEKESSESAR